MFKNWQKDVKLASYTSYQIGGPAEWLVEATTKEELIDNYQLAQKNNLKVTLLGGGTNTLISDQGLHGLVIINRYQTLEVNHNLVRVGSGYNWQKFVQAMIDNSLAGAEAMIGIPGTVGGAIIGNAGCFGQEIKDSLTKILFYSNASGLEELTNHDLHFAYRESLLKQRPGLVLEAFFTFQPADKTALLARAAEVTILRNKNEDKLPSCGCVFKSLPVSPELNSHFAKLNLSLPETALKFQKIPAKWLITEAGLSGKVLGGLKISEINPSFIVNTGGATAEQFIQLTSLIKQQVRDKFGIQLEEEVRWLHD